MVDKIPWDTCVIALIFCVFKTEFYKSTVFHLKLRCFPLPPPLPPIQCWNSGEIACTLVQHCRGRGGGGRGWTSVDEFTLDCLFGACQMWICPKTFVHDCLNLSYEMKCHISVVFHILNVFFLDSVNRSLYNDCFWAISWFINAFCFLF